MEQWRNDRVTRLFTIKGDEIKHINQLFGDQDVFIGLPADQKLTSKEIHDIIEGKELVKCQRNIIYS